MVPPFLATYGAFQKNLTLLEESFNQISLYRDALHDEATGLWRHIALGNWTDDNLWATGMSPFTSPENERLIQPVPFLF
jgi:rhamnogalacturonyl hydrolase YesR